MTIGFGAYVRLRVKVSDSEREVIRRARARILAKHRRAPAMRLARHKFYRAMLANHYDMRQLKKDWRI
jgi:hypothetical protein